jgi:AraC-like DNA-binding protein
MKQSRATLSTAHVPPDKAVSFWNDLLLTIKVGGEVFPKHRDEFFASVDHYPLTNIPLFFCQITPTQYKRTRRDCEKKSADYYGLMHIKEGGGEIYQNGRTVIAHPGECVLLNYKKPYFSRNSKTLRFSELHIPPEVVSTWVPKPDDITAIPLSKRSDWGKALAVTINALSSESLNQPSVTHSVLLKHIGCLLSLAAAQEKHLQSNPDASLLQRFRRLLCDRFDEPNFSSSSLAKECGVSIQMLYSVFANVKSSFGQELLSLRMENARALLDDPRFDRLSISEIGSLVGFPDTCHFMACFNKAHRVSPSAYRAIRRS